MIIAPDSASTTLFFVKGELSSSITGAVPEGCRSLIPFTKNKVVLAESGAIIDYIIAAYGEGRLARTPKVVIFNHWCGARGMQVFD
jgi:hypothetical protein